MKQILSHDQILQQGLYDYVDTRYKDISIKYRLGVSVWMSVSSAYNLSFNIAL